MIRKIAIGIFIVLVVGGGLALIKVMQIRTLMAAGAAFTPPPETVSSATVRQETWQGTLSAIGSVSAARGVTVTPDIPGTVREIAFESGSVVEEGDLLVKLDTSTEEAQLRAVEAQVNLARTELERTKALREQNTVSQSELDTAVARSAKLGGGGYHPRDDCQENHSRAIRRTAGHTPGEPWRISGGRETDRVSSVARSDLRQLFPAATTWPN